MSAYRYNRPGEFSDERDSHRGPQAPGAYPWQSEIRRGGHGSSSYLGDLVDVAKKRAWTHQSGVARGVEVLRHCLMDSLSDDPVFAVHSSLQNTNMPHLHLGFDCDFLCTMGNHPIFTGVLSLTDHFLARGLGGTKESCKDDTYRKAHNLLIGSTTEQVLQQEDIGEHALCQEVYHMYTRSPQTFYDMLQKSGHNAQDYNEAASYCEAPLPILGMKRPYRGPPHVYPSGPPPLAPDLDDKRWHAQGWRDPNSLIPPKINFVMKYTDKLENKLVKLKQLLKEEGITKLHIVPKIDQYAQRVAIKIVNVIRFAEIQSRLGPDCPVFVEVYFDNVLMGLGKPERERANAVIRAYRNLANTMSGVADVTDLAHKGRRWQQFNKMDPDICDIVIKRPGQDNGSLLTTNLANMTQMMQARPDFTISIEHLILTEHEVDKDEHCFKMLELSCTRNNVLLECEITRNHDGAFACTMSANGKYIDKRIHKTKTGCKKKCSEAIMAELLKNNDHIYVSKVYKGNVINKSDLVEEAKRICKSGEPPAKYQIPQPSETKNKLVVNNVKEQRKLEKDRSETDRVENLPENLALRPLLPFMASAMYKLLDEYYQRVTLEDIIIDTSAMAKTQYEMVNFCAIQMGLRVITKVKHAASENCSLLRRTVRAQDMAKICQLNGGTSGRFQLKRLVYPKSDEELAKFKADHLAQHQALVQARQEVNIDKVKDTKPKSLLPDTKPKSLFATVDAIPDAVTGGQWSQPVEAKRPFSTGQQSNSWGNHSNFDEQQSKFWGQDSNCDWQQSNTWGQQSNSGFSKW